MLSVAIYGRPWSGYRFSQGELTNYDVELKDWLGNAHDGCRRDGLEHLDAVLLDIDAHEPSAIPSFVEKCRQCGASVVLITERLETALPLLGAKDGADAVVSPAASSPGLASAIWSARARQRSVKELTQQVDHLQQKLANRRTIERAKAIVAEALKISETDALRHLRREARNRRRSMHEVARVVLEATEIISPQHRGALPTNESNRARQVEQRTAPADAGSTPLSEQLARLRGEPAPNS